MVNFFKKINWALIYIIKCVLQLTQYIFNYYQGMLYHHVLTLCGGIKCENFVIIGTWMEKKGCVRDRNKKRRREEVKSQAPRHAVQPHLALSIWLIYCSLPLSSSTLDRLVTSH